MKIWDNGYFVFGQVKRGSIKAFESLFKESYSTLCSFSFEYVSDVDAAEEIVQDFFFNLWKNRESINIQSSLKAYMYSSVKNSSLNYLEKKKVRQRYFEKVQAEVLNNFSLQTDEELNAKELRGQIDMVLQELPSRCENVFKMSRYEGYTNSEIAKRLSVSIKTVEADMTRTLKLLRERLAGLKNNTN